MQIVKFLLSSKRNVLVVLVVLCLLIVQVYCELSLPRYTSDIVDVGIMQGGIEDAVPNQIRRESLDGLELFMPQADIDTIEKSFREDAQGILRLNVDRAQDKTSIEKLNTIFTVPMLIFISAEKQTKLEEGMSQLTQIAGRFDILTTWLKEYEASAAVSAPRIDLDQLKNGYAAGFVTKDQLLEMRSKAQEEIDKLGDLMSGTAAVSYVENEYTGMNLDMQKIQTDYMKHVGLIMMLYTLASVATSIIVCLLASLTAAGISRTLRKNIFRRVLDFSNREMDIFTGASLITRSTNDMQQIQIALVMFIRLVLFAPIMGIGGIFMVLQTKTGMGWIVAVTVAILLFIVAILLKITMPKFKILQLLVDKLNLVSREILTGLPVIRAFRRENFETKRFAVANNELMKTQLFTNRAMVMMMPLMMFMMNVVAVVIVWFGAKNADAGHLQVGDLLAFITYTIQIVMSFMMLSMISVMLPRANVAAERVAEVLKTETTVQNKPEDQLVDRDIWRGDVEFKDVSFRFPDASEDVLSGISFTADAGKTTAIIGSTGSGKSTLINLIPRLFDVTNGVITIDGVDIRDMDLHRLRSLLGFVPQKGILFSGDIESNLRFGNEEISEEALQKAAEIAQADEFISEKEG
ncbi:MAG: ABC transporter ATP-binding protein, partial [Clostridiales Family XIII bacterium]|nr:ABC transporter ATP-binding protein [Clostridiales Family XIII bacterium]